MNLINVSHSTVITVFFFWPLIIVALHSAVQENSFAKSSWIASTLNGVESSTVNKATCAHHHHQCLKHAVANFL